MRFLISLSVMALVLVASCGTDVDRHTLHSYFLRNGLSDSIQVIGIQADPQAGRNVLFDELIAPQNSLFLRSISVGFAGPEADPLQFSLCDTVLIISEGAVRIRSVNREKHLLPNDSTSGLFNFGDSSYWVEFSRTEYDSDGPQPKEVCFEFLVN